MTAQASLAANSAYRQGICIDCRTAPHSAGRPRCNDCHAIYQQPPTEEAPSCPA